MGRMLYLSYFHDVSRILELDPATGEHCVLPREPNQKMDMGAFDETPQGVVAFFEHDGVMHFMVGRRVVPFTAPRLSVRLKPEPWKRRYAFEMRLGDEVILRLSYRRRTLLSTIFWTEDESDADFFLRVTQCFDDWRAGRPSS